MGGNPASGTALSVADCRLREAGHTSIANRNGCKALRCRPLRECARRVPPISQYHKPNPREPSFCAWVADKSSAFLNNAPSGVSGNLSVWKEIIMGMGVSSVGSGRPAVVPGASSGVAAPQPASAGAGGQAVAATKEDFSSTIQSLLKTLENSSAGGTRGKLNTYA